MSLHHAGTCGCVQYAHVQVEAANRQFHDSQRPYVHAHALGHSMADHPVNNTTQSHIWMKLGIYVYHDWESNYINYPLIIFIGFQDLV